MDYRIELLTLPVTDVDRARDFYANQAGFTIDHDHRVNDELRFVQLTPPGSGCSIAVGEGLIDSEPGTVKGLQMVVDDIEAAQRELAERGLAIGEIQDLDWGRFLFFTDPDGNQWAIQQLPPWSENASS
jgi:predicted enzyme related to lactoylglutathione lyase